MTYANKSAKEILAEEKAKAKQASLPPSQPPKKWWQKLNPFSK